MAAANPQPSAHPQSSASAMLAPPPHDNGTTLIARAEALNAFMKMQPAANQARHAAAAATSSPRNAASSSGLSHPGAMRPSNAGRHASSPSSPSSGPPPSCFCFGTSPRRANSHGGGSGGHGHGGGSGAHGIHGGGAPGAMQATRPPREYYPDNLSVQPAPHPWDRDMEWLIVACVDFLERHGLHERNLFAVSAVDDLVRAMTVPRGTPLPDSTDPHVAAGVIKAKIRHADEPLVAKTCLRSYIDEQNSEQPQQPPQQQQQSSDGGNLPTGASSLDATSLASMGAGANNSDAGAGADSGILSPGREGGLKSRDQQQSRRYQPRSFRQSFLARTIDTMETDHGARRAYILARIMRLLGRVSANIEVSRMNAHSLAKCVAPSMLHWDPNSNFALLMLGKITAYVMSMIEDARIFDEILCQRIDDLRAKGDW